MPTTNPRLTLYNDVEMPALGLGVDTTRKANQDLVDLLGKIADQKNVTPAQIAPPWVPAQKPWIVPISGTTTLSPLQDNIGAVDFELSAEDLRATEDVLENTEIVEARYPEELEERTGR